MDSSVGKPLEDMEELVQRIKKPKSNPRNPSNPYDKHCPQHPEEKMPLGRAAPGKILSSSQLHSIHSSRCCNNPIFLPLVLLEHKAGYKVLSNIIPDAAWGGTGKPLENTFSPKQHSRFGIFTQSGQRESRTTSFQLFKLPATAELFLSSHEQLDCQLQLSPEEFWHKVIESS